MSNHAIMTLQQPLRGKVGAPPALSSGKHRHTHAHVVVEEAGLTHAHMRQRGDLASSKAPAPFCIKLVGGRYAIMHGMIPAAQWVK